MSGPQCTADDLKAGIYAIQNTETGDCYVGATGNLAQRYLQHWAGLRSDWHEVRRMQRDWNRYGEASFKFKVLEICERGLDVLYEREKYWYNQLRSTYNREPPKRISTLARKPKKNFTVRLHEPVIRAIKFEAIRQGIPHSELIERVCIEYLLHEGGEHNAGTD